MDIQRLKEIFDKPGAFAVVVGQNYGVDEMGSALSIYLSLTSRGKDASIISTKQPLVEVSNLVGIDKVRSSYESKNGDLIVAFPYQEDEIGKVSYTLEEGFLNIIVKPKADSLSFGERDVVFKRLGNTPEVLITVGVKRISELQAQFSVESLKDTIIINIDKPGTNEGFGDIVIMGQGASSVAEQVANLMLSLAYPLDPDISQNLMSGITSGTGNFQSPRTSSVAFEMAGILLRNGARRENPRGIAPQQTGSAQQFGRFPQQSQQQIQRVNPQPASPQAVRSESPQAIREFPREQKKDEAPPDWLAPKIFKGSTTVE